VTVSSYGNYARCAAHRYFRRVILCTLLGDRPNFVRLYLRNCKTSFETLCGKASRDGLVFNRNLKKKINVGNILMKTLREDLGG